MRVVNHFQMLFGRVTQQSQTMSWQKTAKFLKFSLLKSFITKVLTKNFGPELVQFGHLDIGKKCNKT